MAVPYIVGSICIKKTGTSNLEQFNVGEKYIEAAAIKSGSHALWCVAAFLIRTRLRYGIIIVTVQPAGNHLLIAYERKRK